ncbi:hypothetical protein ES703_19178 [subsurface metagenome]
MIKKHSLVRTIYLYLFALVGLALLISGTVRFLDMGLKMFIFTKAEDPEKIQRMYYSSPPISVARFEKYQESQELTEEEITTLKGWLADYEEWQGEEAKIDYLASKRQREASGNLAMILVGLPLYFYHWRIIRKETKDA